MKVLASSQAEVGAAARESVSKSRGEGKEGSGNGTNAFGLTPIRSALVEWSINLGGESVDWTKQEKRRKFDEFDCLCDVCD